jgi:hypothetical protein
VPDTILESVSVSISRSLGDGKVSMPLDPSEQVSLNPRDPTDSNLTHPHDQMKQTNPVSKMLHLKIPKTNGNVRNNNHILQKNIILNPLKVSTCNNGPGM